MNLGLISLICLLAAIVIGFVKNCNVGILCTGIAAVLALVFGIKASDIIKGFSASLCIQMVGITYLFAIINGNGTLELLARKMVALVGKQKRLIPFVIYILGFIISAVGPGAIPSLAIIPVIAIPVAASAGINPIMTAIIGDLGVMSGRMSPLTPEAAVVRELMAAQGLEADTVPIMFCLILTALATMVLVYIYYKGWKVDVKAVGKEAELPKFTGKQLLSLAALAGLAVGVLFFSWNVGLMGFLMGSLLIIHIVLAVDPLSLRKFLYQELLVDKLVQTVDLRVCLLNMDNSHMFHRIVASDRKCLHLTVDIHAAHVDTEF